MKVSEHLGLQERDLFGNTTHQVSLTLEFVAQALLFAPMFLQSPDFFLDCYEGKCTKDYKVHRYYGNGICISTRERI